METPHEQIFSKVSNIIILLNRTYHRESNEEVIFRSVLDEYKSSIKTKKDSEECEKGSNSNDCKDFSYSGFVHVALIHDRK